ncbi:GlxA family transcriptional regulator [Mesorhizobium sp. CO1-1-8]|uniref:GlxA family transcriptional regulator n=1 Tax=Mesorhizobium sp. CO1-1-8 TaxID=2876631 RepID=UPI001CD0DFF0|nr:helix-turn-helix domain-containing protein [Mesorhizobium sp. CO1-1-8]MBZ9772539.1 helix-turn-helix domain-containing protein [Mesorhizobium sp. CO1-1-8]
MHEVAVLAMHGAVAFDLAIPCDIFRHVLTPDGMPAYRVVVCGEAPKVRTTCFEIDAPYGLDRLVTADTVVVPGIDDPNMPIPAPVLAAVRTAWANGARISSICTGAFVLAEAGLLDGLAATTHWIYAVDFERRFPSVRLDPNVLFLDEGRIITSAGLSAGLDMCLHIVRHDHGQSVAARSARVACAPLDRDGHQAQFIQREPPRSNASLANLLDWMIEHLNATLTIETLASHACMNPRTFARRFRAQTGTTPVQWILTARIRRAQELLETTSEPIEQVGYAAGFESPTTFRARFQRIVGISPGAYRRRFSARCTAKTATAPCQSTASLGSSKQARWSTQR